MRAIQFVITMSLFLLSISLFAASVVPVVELPAKPTKAKLNQLSKSQELYVNTLLDYYCASVCYEAQLRLMGIQPTKTLVAPTLQQLSKPAVNAIKQQWMQASALYKQVKAVDVLENNANTAAFNESIFRLKNELTRLRADSALQNLQIRELELFRDLYNATNQTVEELKKQTISNTMPLLGVATGINVLAFSDDLMSEKIGATVSLYLNPSKILGIANNSPIWMDCWLDYASPSFTTIVQDGTLPNPTTHSSDYLSVGASVAVHLSQLFDYNSFKWTLRPGIGYYWMNDKIPNLNYVNTAWYGMNFKLETEFTFFSNLTPVGVFASYSFLNTNNDLHVTAYKSTGNNAYSSKWFGSISAGLRFYLINNSY